MTTPAADIPRNPVSQKVYGASGGATSLALVTWALTTYIPSWHSGIPPTLAPLLPGLIGVIGAFSGGYLSTHRVTAQELATALTDLHNVNEIIQKAVVAIEAPLPPGTYNTGSGSFTTLPVAPATGPSTEVEAKP
jgi:hypothetical protein